MRSVVLVSFHILSTPEDAVVQTEHVEGRHSCDTRHNPTAYRTVGKAGSNDFILRTEAREERNTCNSEAADEEGDVGNRHIFAQTAHHSHLVRVNGVDDTTGTEEQAGLEHSMGKEVEHTSHETKLCMIVEHTMMTRQRNTEGHHHEGNLRNGREGQHTLDVALGTSHSSGIESGEDTYPDHDAHLRLSVLNPEGKHTGNLEHTSYHHRSSVDECRNRRRTLHGIGQPGSLRQQRPWQHCRQ